MNLILGLSFSFSFVLGLFYIIFIARQGFSIILFIKIILSSFITSFLFLLCIQADVFFIGAYVYPLSLAFPLFFLRVFINKMLGITNIGLKNRRYREFSGFIYELFALSFMYSFAVMGLSFIKWAWRDGPGEYRWSESYEVEVHPWYWRHLLWFSLAVAVAIIVFRYAGKKKRLGLMALEYIYYFSSTLIFAAFSGNLIADIIYRHIAWHSILGSVYDHGIAIVFVGPSVAYGLSIILCSIETKYLPTRFTNMRYFDGFGVVFAKYVVIAWLVVFLGYNMTYPIA